jgi:hypothetical protein
MAFHIQKCIFACRTLYKNDHTSKNSVGSLKLGCNLQNVVQITLKSALSAQIRLFASVLLCRFFECNKGALVLNLSQ